MIRLRRLAVALALAALCAGCLEEPHPTATVHPVATGAPTKIVEPQVTAAPATSEPGSPLLVAAANGDGDSWKDTSGKEYRLGLINTPEYDECYGSAATGARKRMVANGFRAQVYTTDTYGRLVSVVTTADGTNLNVWLARQGFADDRYLQQFRHENPALAAQLDAAFAAAKAERLGLWSACAVRPAAQQTTAPKTTTPPQSRGGCDPSYPTVCIPPPPPDLDCGDITFRRFTVVAPDPHHFDADHDGIGCESG
jgi:endonuclease YncB( thermonuclease family)